MDGRIIRKPEHIDGMHNDVSIHEYTDMDDYASVDLATLVKENVDNSNLGGMTVIDFACCAAIMIAGAETIVIAILIAWIVGWNVLIAGAFGMGLATLIVMFCSELVFGD